jgi:para-aminobenzoate synthetase / 4-amino-4-deoxychorismate lyase
MKRPPAAPAARSFALNDTMKPTAHSMVLHDSGTRRWLVFRQPIEVLVAHTPAEVAAQLARVEAAAGEGLYAAGFIGYEAAPAFDPAFVVKDPGSFPLSWFGLYRAPEVLPGLAPADPDAYGLDDLRFSVEREAYLRAMAAIKSAIREGETYQVNFTARVRGTLRGDPWDCFLGLTALQQADYCAYLDAGEFAIVSASPECFFELDGDTISCRPMKGTRPRGRWHEEDRALRKDLAGSVKDRAENVMIVDMVRNDLGRVARSGSVRVERLFEVERYPTVWQLTSTVKAATDASLTAILGALFPCASITGAPKHQTMGIIARLEDSPRRIYTGSMGFVAPGRRAQFNVAIRTLLVDKATGAAEYGTGGGIVWDSVPEDEYRECQVKSAILTRRPQAFSLLETLRWEPGAGYYLLEGHLERLEHSAAYFGFALDVAGVRQTLERLAEGLAGGPQKVRLTVRRDGEIRLEAQALPPPAVQPARLGVAAGPVDTGSIFLYHKTTRREVYERACESCPDCDDVVLWNERGEVTETSIANLVLDLNGELVTPPVSSGLLSGVMRGSLLAQGVVRERPVRLEELAGCRRIYLVNSVRRWRRAVLAPGGAQIGFGIGGNQAEVLD